MTLRWEIDEAMRRLLDRILGGFSTPADREEYANACADLARSFQRRRTTPHRQGDTK
jgi:hypothetical protein